ncbi:hypothetical protein HUW62_13860 [Myxococcus sp. AM011]|uniref:bpX5 domain-containing protein n=1 Tax=Myxococcus sp. AM011 TaxID=2745200 RepID=UPI0015960C91|nr:hypothetical protein [Myxococcus sp. AM011]NVJ22305.1 hypothetical protein [Myxococcus sp. AM011]
MSSESQGALSVRWGPRAEPMEPLAVVGVGEVARVLARRALQEDDARLGAWRGVAGQGVLVLLGAAESLPWVDGVLYLGRDSTAPSLLLPCALAPDVVASLLERALLALVGNTATPLAVLPGPLQLVPVASARPVHRATLVAWLAGEEAVAGRDGAS